MKRISNRVRAEESRACSNVHAEKSRACITPLYSSVSPSSSHRHRSCLRSPPSSFPPPPSRTGRSEERLTQRQALFGSPFVDPPGLEPRKAEPESAVLPLHHGSIPLYTAKVIKIFFSTKVLRRNFSNKKVQSRRCPQIFHFERPQMRV